MKKKHFIRLIAIIGWQMAMVGMIYYFDSSPHRWIPALFALSALILPFIAYIAALYDAPVFAKWPRTVKAAFLTFCSVVVTIGGYVLFFLAAFFVTGRTWE
jgi:hypothetical protein